MYWLNKSTEICLINPKAINSIMNQFKYLPPDFLSSQIPKNFSNDLYYLEFINGHIILLTLQSIQLNFKFQVVKFLSSVKKKSGKANNER